MRASLLFLLLLPFLGFLTPEAGGQTIRPSQPNFFAGPFDPGTCREGDFYYNENKHAYSICGAAAALTKVGAGGAVTACSGSPGNTVGGFMTLCQTAAGAVYACNNAAGCTVAVDWVGAIVGLLPANNLSDVANAGTSRTNLGLAAVAASGSASDLGTGTLPINRIAANAVTASKQSVATTYRTCIFSNDTQGATALVAAQFSGNGCAIAAAATIVEVDVTGGTGIITATPAAPTYTGTSSIQIGKTGASSSTALLSGALATVSGKACAQSTISQACLLNGVTSSGTITISTTALSAGDELYVTAATPDTVQTWYAVTVIMTVN